MSADVGWLIAAAGVGYLLGSVNPATVIARVRDVDLRATGSGNPGATNAARAMGTRTGVVVGLLDVAKGFLPAVFFTVYCGHTVGDVAGFAAVLGHITSPWLRGRGGKGAIERADRGSLRACNDNIGDRHLYVSSVRYSSRF